MHLASHTRAAGACKARSLLLAAAFFHLPRPCACGRCCGVAGVVACGVGFRGLRGAAIKHDSLRALWLNSSSTDCCTHRAPRWHTCGAFGVSRFALRWHSEYQFQVEYANGVCLVGAENDAAQYSTASRIRSSLCNFENVVEHCVKVLQKPCVHLGWARGIAYHSKLPRLPLPCCTSTFSQRSRWVSDLTICSMWACAHVQHGCGRYMT